MQADTLSVQEIQQLIGRSRPTVYKAAEAGDIPARRVAGGWIFPRVPVLQWFFGDAYQAESEGASQELLRRLDSDPHDLSSVKEWLEEVKKDPETAEQLKALGYL